MHLFWTLLVAGLIAACPDLIATESVTPASHLTIVPAFLRCDLEAQASRDIDVLITSPIAGQVRAVETDCRCVHVTTRLPLVLDAGAPAHLTIHVSGAIPGLKSLRLQTSVGAVVLPVEVVSRGLGKGLDQVRSVLADAARMQAAVWFIVHNLHGEVRNCGCSDGSLGGIDHLAALPQLCHELAPTITTRFVLVGDTEGMRTGLASALAKSGWESSPADVLASSRPELDIEKDQVIAVVPEVPAAINHAKLVRIPLDGGVVAAALLVLDSRVREQHLVAIDRSLTSDPAILAGFTGMLSRQLDASASTSGSCLPCHAAAHQAWETSAHARAWASLQKPDQIDECARCHSTSLTAAAIAPGVQCQGCHQGADAHAVAPASVHTTGTTDCRSCHDERRHPTFARDAAWALIQHR